MMKITEWSMEKKTEHRTEIKMEHRIEKEMESPVKKERFQDDENKGPKEMPPLVYFDDSMHTTQSTYTSQSSEESQDIGDSIIKIKNEPHTSNEIPIVPARINNKKYLQNKRAERYRNAHRDEVNKRRRENYYNKRHFQSNPSSSDSDRIESVPCGKDSSTQMNHRKDLNRIKNQRYRHKHKEQINRRRRENYSKRKQNEDEIVQNDETYSNCSDLFEIEEIKPNFGIESQHGIQNVTRSLIHSTEGNFDKSKFFRLQDFEERAQHILPQSVYKYYASGEGKETTLKWNREKFENYRIIPRMLRDVSKRDISTTVLGEKISMPLGVSPTGFQRMAHPDGECGNAKAVEAANTVFILSEFSMFTINEVAKAAPNAIKWMQVFISKDKDLTLHIVQRAEEAGFKALVLIVDSPVCGDAKADHFDTCAMTYISKIAVLQDYIETKSDLSKKYLNNIGEFAHQVFNDSVTWDDIAWLKSLTKLPIILKGILSPEDALLGVKHGASAIFVSNHGGRQLDGVPATIEVLSDIVKAVGDKVEVYLDGGIRCGTDIFIALALGARMVFIGRSMLWGLACGGEKGAHAVLDILRNEIDTTFALAGCSTVNDITKDRVVHESYFNR